MAKLRIKFPVYQQPKQVSFGSGAIRTLTDVGAWDDATFFVSGQSIVRDVLEKGASKQGISVDPSRILTKPSGEPCPETIRMGAEFLRGTDGRRLVAVGGGSVLDWCRLAWAESRGLNPLQSPRLECSTSDPSRPELWLVPTTCGTGAEAANVAVYTTDEGKRAVVSDAFLADHVILDGQFLDHLELHLLECLLADTLSHSIESFVSLVPCYLAKEAALSALGVILENYDAPASTCRNERLMEAGYLGGLAAAHCSVGIVHAFAHSVAPHGIRHGHANALGLVAGIRTNAEVPAMQRLLSRFGWSSVEDLVERIQPIVRIGSSYQDVAEIAELLRDGSSRDALSQRMLNDVCIRTNPRQLTQEDVGRFLDQVYETVVAA